MHKLTQPQTHHMGFYGTKTEFILNALEIVYFI